MKQQLRGRALHWTHVKKYRSGEIIQTEARRGKGWKVGEKMSSVRDPICLFGVLERREDRAKAVYEEIL